MSLINKISIVDLYLGDLEFIKDSKRKQVEKAFNKDIDSIIDDLQSEYWLKYSDKISITVFPDLSKNEITILMWVQWLSNSWYKHIYKTTDTINFWIKK